MSTDAEARLLRMSVRQYSVFSHAQAIASGLGRTAIQGRVERGLWVRLHRGVYVPAGIAVGWEQRVVAACLACGADATASFDSGGLVWTFLEDIDMPHVTIRAKSVRAHTGIVVHRANTLDAATYKGFRVTSPMRTIIDLADRLPADRLGRVLDNAHRRGLVELRRLRRKLDDEEHQRRAGSGVLRELIDSRDPDTPLASDLESIFFDALRATGLPIPVPQHSVRTRRQDRDIDFAYPDAGLAIEVDGWEEHGTRQAFEDDRLRQNELEELGWHVLRFTWKQVQRDPLGVAYTIGTALGLAPRRWGRAHGARRTLNLSN
jgi:very-short-patch-repair endonuclease